jgi:hypothetical protein
MTVVNKPPTWKEWKNSKKWPRLSSFELGLEWILYHWRRWAFFELMEYIGKLSVLYAAISWVWEYDDRQQALENSEKEKQYRAWELIYSAKEAGGDSGRRQALVDLRRAKVDLSAVPLANASLPRIDLSNACLSRANFAGADLSGADLSGANLGEANLTGANLTGANLTDAILTGAMMSGAVLAGSDMKGSDITKASLKASNITGIKFSNANLCEADLGQAKVLEGNMTDTIIAGLLCRTAMPNGSINTYNCNQDKTCRKADLHDSCASYHAVRK